MYGCRYRNILSLLHIALIAIRGKGCVIVLLVLDLVQYQDITTLLISVLTLLAYVLGQHRTIIVPVKFRNRQSCCKKRIYIAIRGSIKTQLAAKKSGFKIFHVISLKSKQDKIEDLVLHIFQPSNNTPLSESQSNVALYCITISYT